MNKERPPFFSFFSEKNRLNLKKTDWIALALAGVILLILMMPETKEDGNFKTTVTSDETAAAVSSQSLGNNSNKAELYVMNLEEKLEKVLRKMEGVGEVEVMITISDYGEAVVEKDLSEASNSVTETDKNGGSRTSVDKEMQAQTVHVEDGNGTYPYIEKELLPTIEGIMVVAEGGGNSLVVSKISEAVMALFPIDAHKIIVVKMSSKGE